MSKVLLTQAIVNDARCEPSKKHTEICDLQVPGLSLTAVMEPPMFGVMEPETGG